MAILFRCQHCDAKMTVPDEKAGKNGKCPQCEQIVFVPFETEAEFRNVGDEESNILMKKPTPEIEPMKSAPSVLNDVQEFDQTLLLHLPASLDEEVTSAKRDISEEDMFDAIIEEEEEDLLFLDDESEVIEKMPELIDDTALEDSEETLDGTFFNDLIEDDDEPTEAMHQPRKTFANRETAISRKPELKPVSEPTPKPVPKPTPIPEPSPTPKPEPAPTPTPLANTMTAPMKPINSTAKPTKPPVSKPVQKVQPSQRRAPEQRKKVSQRPTPAIQPKSRLDEHKSRRKPLEKTVETETPAKKSGGGFFWVLFGIILALAHTAAAFILGAWFMLERVERGKSPVDPAFEIMKFDDKLDEIDHKLKLNENPDTENKESE